MKLQERTQLILETNKTFFLTIAFAGVGWFVAVLTGIKDLENSSVYFNIINLLLAIGLYGSAYSINIDQFLKRDWSVILRAVTVGVLLKILFIITTTYLVSSLVSRYFFADMCPKSGCLALSIVIGPIVAQIDPLSVAALIQDNPLSKNTKDILSAWASFDDPVTVIASIYIASWIASNNTGVVETSTFNILSVLLDFGKNFLFAFLFCIWQTILFFLWSKFVKDKSQSPLIFKVFIASNFLTSFITIILAARYRLMLGVAIIGLFAFPKFVPNFRFLQKSIISFPKFVPSSRLLNLSSRFIQTSVTISFYIATVMIGLLLVDGINIRFGILVALSAIAAQFFISFLVTVGYGYPCKDKIRLAFAQQNGLTAIVLALFFEPLLTGTVSVIAPAILLINLIYIIVNNVFLRKYLKD